MEEFYMVDGPARGEIVEKKSRFIANVFPVDSEEQALEIIEKTKKQYWDARHNCFAFVIGKNNEVQRFSDDGEPQGTAGKPILEVLTKGNIHNTLIIVTRYFGGTLLGTGGLVRAYGQSSKAAIENSRLLRVCEGVSFSVECDYNSIGKIKYIIAQMNIEAKEEYGANVKLDIEMSKENFEKFKSQVVEATNGQAVFSRVDDIEHKQKCTD